MTSPKSIFKQKKRLVLSLLLIPVLLSPVPHQFFKRNTAHDLQPLMEYKDIRPADIDSSLYLLEKVFQTQGADGALYFARQRAIDMRGESVRVVLERSSEGNYDLMNFVQALGGKIETSYGNLVQTLTPLYSLQALSYFPGIKQIRLPLKSLPCAVLSEGVAVTGADYWQAIPSFHNETKVKVAVLDAGFEGYEGLLGSELPDSVTVKSFRQDKNITTTKHGTACAEIIHDMAPQAELWLINYETDVEFYNAVDYLLGQGINIISYSRGWVNAGAGDGTGPISSQVKKANDNHVVWVSAAGDETQNHWQGNFRDSDEDQWNNFGLKDNTLHFNCNQGNLLQIFLNWDDWGNWNEAESTYGGSSQDYDLYLYKETGKDEKGEPKLSLLAHSSNAQTGTQWPVESIEYQISESGRYHVKIKNESTSRNCKLELFFRNATDLEYLNPEESLLIPADSPNSLSVGATNWENDSYDIHSSQGPTAAGRVKPDYCAPSGVRTASYKELGFSGSSAATPHVAGALALLKAKTAFSLDEIKIILQKRALDLGPSGKDNQFGWGRLRLVIR